jgi:hypothetical protein
MAQKSLVTTVWNGKVTLEDGTPGTESFFPTMIIPEVLPETVEAGLVLDGVETEVAAADGELLSEEEEIPFEDEEEEDVLELETTDPDVLETTGKKRPLPEEEEDAVKAAVGLAYRFRDEGEAGVKAIITATAAYAVDERLPKQVMQALHLLKNPDLLLEHRFATCIEKARVACAAFLLARSQSGRVAGMWSGPMHAGADGREIFDDASQAVVSAKLGLFRQALLELNKVKEAAGLQQSQLNMIAEADQLFDVKTSGWVSKNVQALCICHLLHSVWCMLFFGFSYCFGDY